ncbi:mechanosensitive ion channel family protein [Aureliella helgolandensis]|uniref:Small-conductance mechanosensitive channel n=1 Tax=Aureliella helgolandensis TaxID=2527968 RepID=A0A518G3R4_9BACT|nr:mechanosensitive ion channel family protein [Aureliella helgolandensis]QDV23234.1 Small-conductance mechanosensitive channel [Aureliella helgolandensis]
MSLPLSDRCLFRPLVGFLTLVWVAFISSSILFAQEKTAGEVAASPPLGQEESPEAPSKVDVKPIARDDEIALRLTSILDSTQYFGSPAVAVENGVVFLSGVAAKPDYKTWAGDLARNTQDVAAVVNRMTVAEKSIWDFSAAFGELRNFQTSAVQAIPLLIFGLVVLLLAWLIAKLTSLAAGSLLVGSVPNKLLRWVISKAIMLPILIFGIYLVLRISGLTQLALTVLGGTGLIGLVIGIAFQDIAENFLASILISIQKPFRIGDQIEVAGHEGIVRRVTTRGTTLMSLDGNLIQIPNSQVYKSLIVNFTANPTRRVSFDVGVGYDDSASKAQQTILDKIKQHPSILEEPPAKVLIDSLAAATVNLRVLFWIDGEKNDWLSVRSSVMRLVKQSLQLEGISLPDEAREVIFPKGVPVLMSPNGIASSGTEPENPSSTHSTTESSHPFNPKPLPPRDQPDEPVVSEAEGDMKSEVADLQRQADNSWLPGAEVESLVSE